MLLRMGTVLAVALAVPGAVNADIMNVNVTVRDFSPITHPDFEYTVAEDYGFVGTTIGADRKPVYVGAAGGTPTTHGQTYFDQWYNDVPGINLSTPVTLAFDNGLLEPGGIYTFYTETFFPIDDMLLGNEYNAHNYHFTMEMHTQFAYQPGQVFDYRSDDDLFVFINDQLVVDLGGTAPARERTLSLNTLGLTPGEIYHYDLFFAERHTVDSVLRMQTAVVPVPAALLLGMLGLGAAGWRLRKSV